MVRVESIFTAVEALTKGIEMELPEPHSFMDKDGIQRRHVRARWWDTEATTYRASAVMPDRERQALPEHPGPAHTGPRSAPTSRFSSGTTG